MRALTFTLFFLFSCAIFGQSRVDNNNSFGAERGDLTVLGPSETITGSWTVVSEFASIIVKAIADQDGTLSIQFSGDCIDLVSQLDYTVEANIVEIHRVASITRCFRVAFTNTSDTSHTLFFVQSLLGNQGLLTYPLDFPLQGDFDAVVVRSSSDRDDLSLGLITNKRIFHVFGRNRDVGALYETISFDSIYRTPQPADAQQLRIAAGDIEDDINGDGARKILLEGLDETGAEIVVVVDTAGTSPSLLTTETFLRLIGARVLTSGTYVDLSVPSIGSHAANIVVETSSGEIWALISETATATGIAQIGAFTIPLGFTGTVTSYIVTVDANKVIDFGIFIRDSILTDSPPYGVFQFVEQVAPIDGLFQSNLLLNLGPIPELSDIGIIARTTGGPNADVSVHFELVLVKNPI